MFLGVCVHVYVCAYMSVERGRRIEKPTATTINVIEFVYMLRIFQHKQNRFNYNLKANEKVFVSLLLVATPFANFAKMGKSSDHSTTIGCCRIGIDFVLFGECHLFTLSLHLIWL